MPIGDVYEVKHFSQSAMQMGLNVRHWRVITSTPPEPTLSQIASALGTTFSALYRALESAQATYVTTSVRKINPLPISIEVPNTAGAGVGAVAGDLLPKQTAGVISLRSTLAGRKNRGRAYIPFPSEDDSSLAAAPTAGYVTRLLALATAFFTDQTVTVGAGSIVLRAVIWQRKTRTTIDIAGVIARSSWGTQRRRGDFGRTNLPPS